MIICIIKIWIAICFQELSYKLYTWQLLSCKGKDPFQNFDTNFDMQNLLVVFPCMVSSFKKLMYIWCYLVSMNRGKMVQLIAFPDLTKLHGNGIMLKSIYCITLCPKRFDVGFIALSTNKEMSTY